MSAGRREVLTRVGLEAVESAVEAMARCKVELSASLSTGLEMRRGLYFSVGGAGAAGDWSMRSEPASTATCCELSWAWLGGHAPSRVTALQGLIGTRRDRAKRFTSREEEVSLQKKKKLVGNLLVQDRQSIYMMGCVFLAKYGLYWKLSFLYGL